VIYPRGSVKNGPYAVPGEGRTDRMKGISDDFVYSPANAIEGSTRPASVNTSLECSICHLHEVSARFVNISDEESRRGITVIAVEVDCYIDVNYIPILERSIIWYAMRNNVIDTGATRTGKALV
jgi:hypothetical protein